MIGKDRQCKEIHTRRDRVHIYSADTPRTGGHIAVIGILNGIGGPIPLGLALARQVRLQSLLVGNRQHQIDMIRAIEVTGLRPIIDRRFPMNDLVKAFEYQLSGHHLGKICLDM